MNPRETEQLSRERSEWVAAKVYTDDVPSVVKALVICDVPTHIISQDKAGLRARVWIGTNNPLILDICFGVPRTEAADQNDDKPDNPT